MCLTGVLLIVLLLYIHLPIKAENYTNQFYVTHLNPDASRRVKSSPHSTKLIGAISEFPLSYYPIKDSNGSVIRKEGVAPLIFWWTADRFNFNAELMERTIPRPFDRNTTLPFFYYEMLNGPFNLALGFFVMTPIRNRFVDFTQPFFVEPLTLIIPEPKLNGDIWSAWKMFTPATWICLFASMISLGATFTLFNWHYSKGTKPDKKKLKFRGSWAYSIEVVLNQGATCYSKSIPVRLLAGIRCLMACVIVNTYNSTLIAHLLLIYPYQIISSIYQLPEQTAVKLVVKQGSGIDFLFSTAEQGFYKQLGEMLRSQPISRCANDTECLALVRSGSYAYANPEFAAFDAMIKEYQSTGKCEFNVIREYSLAVSMAFFTLKESPVREVLDRGILEMKGQGIVDGWIANNRPKLRQCPKLDSRSRHRQKGDKGANPRLSLRSLTSAFVVLGFGMTLSLFVFVGELIAKRCKSNLTLPNQ